MRRELRQADMHIPLNKSTIGEEERNAAKAVIDSDALTMGARCRAFEQEFANYLGVDHAVMVNSGSSANLIALFAMADALVPTDDTLPRRILPGSEVIVPALTCRPRSGRCCRPGQSRFSSTAIRIRCR
jgi:CDP-6-deoxy-D-xylo-4-hexulose-3-dehydrase